MPGRILPRLSLLLASAMVAIGALAIGSSAASAEVVYNNVPEALAGNYASVGAEAYSYAEFGGQMELAGTARNKPTVEVVMSAWACQFGTWYQATCETPQPQKKVAVPMTLKMYEVGEKNAVGEKIGEVSHTFKMPYRPSDSTKCVEGRWYDEAEKTCYHGLAFKIKFPALKVLRMPKKVIIGLSYNTSHYGPAPLGDKNPCNAKSAGCYYDALNIGLAEPVEKLLTTGADPAEPYINISNPGASSEACGNEAGTAGKFGPSECPVFWEGDQPLIRITAH